MKSRSQFNFEFGWLPAKKKHHEATTESLAQSSLAPHFAKAGLGFFLVYWVLTLLLGLCRVSSSSPGIGNILAILIVMSMTTFAKYEQRGLSINHERCSKIETLDLKFHFAISQTFQIGSSTMITP